MGPRKRSLQDIKTRDAKKHCLHGAAAAATTGAQSRSAQTQSFSCSECPFSFTSQAFHHRHIRRSHSHLYREMLRDGLIDPAAACQQVADPAPEERVYFSADSIQEDDHKDYMPVEFFNSLTPSGIPDQVENCVESRLQMNSPDPYRLVSVKQEEPDDQPDLNILHMVVCKEEVSPEQERSPSPLLEEPQPLHIKEEQEELLQIPEEFDGSMLPLLSDVSEVEVKLESDTEDCDDREGTSGGALSRSAQSQSFSCSECPFSFTSQAFHHRHIRRSHSHLYREMLRDGLIDPAAACQQVADPAPRQPGENPFNCVRCDQSYSSSDALKRHHQIVHDAQKPFHCTLCGDGFLRSIDLRTHQRIHTGEKPFHCTDCDKSYQSSYGMKIHQCLVHTWKDTFPA